MTDSSDKSQAPTPRRRQLAREQGQVVRSQDLASSIAFLGALGGLYYFGGGILNRVTRLIENALSGNFNQTHSIDEAVDTWRQAGVDVGLGLLPLFAVFLVVALIANIGQTGWLFLPGKASIDPTRVNPWTGLSRVFSLRGGARLGFGMTKAIVVCGVTCWFAWRRQSDILDLSNAYGMHVGTQVASLCFAAGLQVGVALFILAALDYGFEYWQHEQELRMTPREVLEELKSIEGDPEIRARQRQRPQPPAPQTLSHEHITFVVFSSVGSVALRYVDSEMETPMIVNKGTGDQAHSIQQRALSQNIPCVVSHQLDSQAYSACQVGHEVPSQLYHAVAQAWQHACSLSPTRGAQRQTAA